MRYFSKIFTPLISMMLLSGCGFHLQTTKNLPLKFRSLYVVSDNTYGEITQDLRRRLQAEQVHIAASLRHAALILTLSNSKTSTNIPITFDSSLASTYYYAISVSVCLKVRHGAVLLNRVFTANQAVTHNVNQVSSAAFTTLMRATLIRRLVIDINNALTDNNIRNQLEKLQAHDSHSSQPIT